MKILDYPRPDGDTGIGFHWFPDVYHYSDEMYGTFMPRLKALGTSWLTILSEPDKPIPGFFVKGLIEQGIEPVVRIYTPTVRPFEQSTLRALCETYARWGVHYIHVYNEPNLEGEWDTWNPDNLPETFMGHLLPCLETMYSVDGIVPVLTPLAPGGNYRDIEFFRIMLDQIIASGKTHLFNKLAIGIHNYALNHPLDWGQGGHEAWPCAEPLNTPPGCQDSNGFRQFEWYDELVRERTGKSLPMICGENGALPGSCEDANYVPVDAGLHAALHTEMARLVMENEVPYYVFNNAFWILSAPEGSRFAEQRWYRDDGEPELADAIVALEALPKHPRALIPTFNLPAQIRLLMPDGSVQPVSLEEYLRGVVPAEMPASAPLEALKAQAVAARSYAVTSRRHAREGANLCTTTHCQCWRPTTHTQSDQAVAETNGLVAVYGDRIIRGFYFKGCDGHTRNSEDVWVQRLPYCRSVPCIAPLPEKQGHGVGLCQVGAMAMAESGARVEEIIAHYYTGAQVRAGEGTLPPELRRGVVSGTVRDADGTPRSAMRVVLRRGTWGAQTHTNEHGEFQFIGLTPGTYAAEVADRAGEPALIEMDGVQAFALDFVLSRAAGWTMEVTRQPGLRLLIGKLPRTGIDVTVYNAWGNSVTVSSGSKPEHGAGAFEVPIWTHGLYTIRFLDQTFQVEINDETVIATFIEGGDPPVSDTRLASAWQPLTYAQELLGQLQGNPAFSDWFSLEEQLITGEVDPAAPWQVQISRQSGLRLIVGRFPTAGLAVVVTDPWGNATHLLSGSKPEHAPGGFEVPVWHDGTYTVQLQGQLIAVEMQNGTVFLDFSMPGDVQGRLVSTWLPETTAIERLKLLQASEQLAGQFVIVRE